MKISQALRLSHDARIAFVGAGGKTTSMFRCARQYGGKICVSATAHLAKSQLKFADKFFVINSENDLVGIEAKFVNGINLIIGPEGSPERMQGLDWRTIRIVKEIADQVDIPLLIESDGARLHPLKAPAEHEPPIPPWIPAVMVVAGLSAVGKALTEQNVFRSELFAKLTGAAPGSNVTLEHICSVLLHPGGGLKNIPDRADKIVLFNQVDTSVVRPADIMQVRNRLLEKYRSILVSSMEDADNEVHFRYENIAGVILAAGQSERFGAPKQLLDWKGKPFVRAIVETAITGGLFPVVVVVGAVVEPIIRALNGLSVEIVVNETWSEGLSSSIRAGLQRIENRCQGVVFLMSDMPQIPAEVIQEQLAYQSNHDYFILASRVNGQRTNPSMFDLRCFDALKQLEGDTGGRQIFNKFPVKWLDIQNSNMAVDVDTPEDYDFIKKSS